MKILVLHRIPYHKIDYGRGIDHDLHEVTYFGESSVLESIPSGLRCEKVLRPEGVSLVEGALASFPGDFDRVISLSEYELQDAAQLREVWKVPGPTVSQIERVRNKVLMKAVVSAAGIDVPRNLACHLLAHQDQGELWTGRTVLKPVDGASSENVLVFPTCLEAMRGVLGDKTGIPGFSAKNYQIEEFIEGSILHIDGLVSEGEVISILASRYLGTCLEFAQGKPLGSVQLDSDVSQDLFRWAKRVLNAVEIKAGAFHLEAILTPRGPVFLEIGARVGGADVVDTYELATGIHLPSAELKIIMGGNNVKEIAEENGLRGCYGWFVFPGHHLDAPFCQVAGVDNLPWNPQVVRWNQLSAHESLPQEITYQSREVPVAGILQGHDSASVERMMKLIFREISIIPKRLEPFAMPTPRWI